MGSLTLIANKVQRRPPRPEAPTDWLEDKKLWDRGYAATSARGEMVTVAMRDGFAKAQRWEDGTSGLLPEPYCSAFANLPWLLSVLPCLFRDRRRCSAVIGASVIANPTPVALRSAIALAILIQLLAAVAIIPARTGSPDVADR